MPSGLKNIVAANPQILEAGILELKQGAQRSTTGSRGLCLRPETPQGEQGTR